MLAFYTIGALAMTAVFAVFTLVPSIGLVFILIGTFPFLALAVPKSINLDMENGPVAVLSGVLVTAAQLLAGASGPVLDIFYVQSEMTKEQILGTKAVTQTLGHILKLIYYGAVMAVASTALPLWVVPAVFAAAILGNYLGSLVVARMTDNQFKQIGRYVIMVIGVVCIGKGILELTS